MNKTNKQYKYRESTKHGKKQKYRQSSNNTRNNNTYNESYENNSKKTENNNRSDIPKSKKIMPDINNKFLRN